MAFGADAAAIDPRDAELRRRVVQKKARFEIVGAVDDEVDAVAQARDVVGPDIGDDRFDLDLGIDGAELFGGGDRFGQVRGNVGLIEEHLPLQVIEFDKVPIDDPEFASVAR